ncbi:MAG: LysM peptidoglycan-binding domain-containing protein [Clostridia bacterium]|nr:LysM peptidoglycan-binding domain-containing protein [Clostridia bacterium]
MIDKVKLKNLSDVKTEFIYKVEKDETVFSLAEKFHTTVQVIVKINGLTDEIKCGQFILIERIDGEEYYVKPKDTILEIAKGDVQKKTEIIAKNRIDYLYVGQKLYL